MEERFFTHNRGFYKTFFGMMLVLTLQNLVAYSVNMADNLMLGSYSQNALSGAATVNQIFFMVQQFALAFGNALVVLASQYWGENRKDSSADGDCVEGRTILRNCDCGALYSDAKTAAWPVY